LVEENLSFIGPDESHRHVKSGGFARPVWSKQTDDLTLLHINGDMVDDGPAFIPFYQVFGSED
jgi:hypothetical protein